MGQLRKHLSKIIMAAGIIGLFSLTSCSLFKNNNDGQVQLSRDALEKLEDQVDPLVEKYFNDKYGVKAVVTHKGISGGVFLGTSKGLYYNITVNIGEDGNEEKYYVNVYPKNYNELYVKSEAYYGKVIKEKMEKWIDGYVNDTNIDEYYTKFFSSSSNLFSSEYDVNASAEEIIKSVSSIEDNSERPSLIMHVCIPQREYEKNSNIENEFSELKSHIEEINGKIKLTLNIYADDDYLDSMNDKINNPDHKIDCESIKIIE
ncbi:hypothetical protein [Ruminococcus albus]|uniref:Lipoprotein n=1 Tax=Ruminococcus albus (strain ATCC 27210 / DSM 20455 / JCM 14654 / NCDO 2250 / 7) TaxID=697329 RepID=E6UFN6_RUMA7|nr:hypothetical protein [Ruminococcus albus]ADU23025.1 hypothetical protein Rumal_2550 [Ruminococcus albus 7 = DSM 20455]